MILYYIVVTSVVYTGGGVEGVWFSLEMKK